MYIDKYCQAIDQLYDRYELQLKDISISNMADVHTISSNSLKLLDYLDSKMYEITTGITNNSIAYHKSYISRKEHEFSTPSMASIELEDSSTTHSRMVDSFDAIAKSSTTSESLSIPRITGDLHRISQILFNLDKMQDNIQSFISRLKSLSSNLKRRLNFTENELISLLKSLSSYPRIGYNQYATYLATISSIKELYWFEDFEPLDILKEFEVLFISKDFESYDQFLKSSEYENLITLRGSGDFSPIGKLIGVLLSEIQNRIRLRLDKYQKLSEDVSFEQSKYRAEFNELLEKLNSLPE